MSARASRSQGACPAASGLFRGYDRKLYVASLDVRRNVDAATPAGPTDEAAARYQAAGTLSASPRGKRSHNAVRPSDVWGMIGDPGRTRTCNPRSRNPLLYPVELRDRLEAGLCASLG